MSSEQKVLTWKQQDTSSPTQTASINHAPCASVITAYFWEHRANAVCKCRIAEWDCHFGNVQHSPSIRLTFTLCFSALASTLSNTGLHYFWMEAGACVHVCLWVEGKSEAMYLRVSVCWDASSCDWSLNPFSSNRFIIFIREIVISPNLPFNDKKKK